MGHSWMVPVVTALPDPFLGPAAVLAYKNFWMH